jgi:hypothetical protein
MSDDTTVVTDGTATVTTTNRLDDVVTVTDPGAFTGRMDQMNQMLALRPYSNTSIADGFTAGRITHDMGDGYSAESQVLGLGHNVVTDSAMAVGAGINYITTDITGADSIGSMSTTVLSFGASKHIEDKDVTVRGQVNASSTDLSYARTIGDFGAAGATTASDNWGTLTVEKSTGTVRPFAGYTVGKRSHEAYAETGDVQVGLLDAGNNETYRYATVGINIDNGILNVSFARDFDDAETTRIGLGLNHNVNKNIGIEAGVNRITAGENTSTKLNAGLTWKF